MSSNLDDMIVHFLYEWVGFEPCHGSLTGQLINSLGDGNIGMARRIQSESKFCQRQFDGVIN